MSHQKDRNGGTEWQGTQPLDNLPTLVAQSFRVGQAQGRNCSGSLTLFDEALKKPRQFSWQAQYNGEQRWGITGKEAGAMFSDSFSPNKSVNHEITVFIMDRLNDMKRKGFLFKPSPKPAALPQPPPKPLAPPPQPGSKPQASASPALPGAGDVAPPMLAVRIPVNRIRRNADQPRITFRRHALKELADSMKEHEQRQLIEVIRVYDDPNADYEIITGERRWRAAKFGGITHLNAIVKNKADVPDKDKQHLLCFVADFHREGYTKLEIALALMRQMKCGLSVEQLRKICGRSIAWVYQHLALNDLVPELQKLLDPSLSRSEQLSFSIGCRIARAPKDRQMEIHQKVSAITGSRLRLIEVNRLLDEINPERPVGRPRTPHDYIRNLHLIVPRATADALTASGYSDKTFMSLVDHTGAQALETMLSQLDTAIQGLTTVQRKIREAQKSRQKK